MKIGEYEYPTQTTFAEALSVTEEAYKKYGGVMPAQKLAEKLGYRIKNAASISGTIYRRFDEIAQFGLFVRERGGIRVNDIGKAALDPYDQEKAARARADAIRNIPIVQQAFTQLQGKLPDDDAFPSMLRDLAGVDWKEAQEQSEGLRRLFSECFPILAMSGSSSSRTLPRESNDLKTFEPLSTDAKMTSGTYGEIRTIVGSVVLRNEATIKLAHSLLDVLHEEITAKKNAETALSGS